MFFGDRDVAKRAVGFKNVAVAQKERRAAGVDERDHAEEDFVRELFDVQRSGDRQPDVIERFQFPEAVFQLKIAFARFLRQTLVRQECSHECRCRAK